METEARENDIYMKCNKEVLLDWLEDIPDNHLNNHAEMSLINDLKELYNRSTAARIFIHMQDVSPLISLYVEDLGSWTIFSTTPHYTSELATKRRNMYKKYLGWN